MKEHTNKSNGRKPKCKETRKAVTFRITPTAAKFLKQWAENLGCSQSDLVNDWLDGKRNP